MSFSRDVKKELSKISNLANKKEVEYEFFGYLASNNISKADGLVKYSTENDYNIDRFTKIARNMGIEDFDIEVSGNVFVVKIKEKMLKKLGNINYNIEDLELIKCFIRGVFMGSRFYK